MKTSVVIPLYNNSATLKKQIDRCLDVMAKTGDDFELLICNDASTDQSGVLLEKLYGKNRRVEIFHHTQNQGIAPTIFFLYGKAKYDYVALFSADGEWDASDIRKMSDEAMNKDCDIVIGQRNKFSYTPYRKAVSFLYNLLPVLFFGKNVIDAGSIKLFRKKIFTPDRILSRSLFFEAEMIIRALKKGYKISSVPVTYFRDKKDSGTAAKWQNVLASIRDLLSLRIALWKENFRIS